MVTILREARSFISCGNCRTADFDYSFQAPSDNFDDAFSCNNRSRSRDVKKSGIDGIEMDYDMLSSNDDEQSILTFLKKAGVHCHRVPEAMP